ncbi:MAG TPA: sigma-70 family RNA polymerase sigma factor [Bryobacteraceae bacterium]|nr:sigma-70 family RNA polymerase sigma factor [Bryobacteraceae bacterium]
MSDAASLSGIRLGQKPSDLERIYRQSNAEEFGFTFPQFTRLIEGLSGSSAAVDALRLDDLLLARACARGHEPSWDRFLALYREKLYGAALAMTRDASGARELADSMYADLFGTRTQQDGKRVSKLESYMGRGSLEGWLRTVLAQQHVNRFRTERKLVAFDEAIEIMDEREITESHSAEEQAYLARATDTALESLSSEERFLLAAYYLDGRTLAEIGRMLRLHESSVSRRLEKTTSALRKRIVKELGRIGVTKSAANEMLQMDVRYFGGSLNALVRNRLAQEGQPGSFAK